MNKKAVAILGFIFLLILGTLGFLIYSKRAGTNPPPSNAQQDNTDGTGNNDGSDQTDNNQNNNGTPAAQAAGKFYKLSSEQAISPALFAAEDGITYLDNSGKVYLADFEYGSSQLTLSRKRLLDYPLKSNVEKVLWPLTGENFIVQTSDAGQPRWSFFSVQAKQYTDFPPQVISIDWMPDGKRIMYIWLDKDKAALYMSDADGGNYQLVADMWEPDDSIHVSPDGLNVLFYRMKNQDATNTINLTTPDGKLWSTLVKDGYNYGVLWSPDSKKFLFGKKDLSTSKFELWSYDLLTKEAKDLGVATTPDKAVWAADSQSVYAAVPVSGTAGSGDLTVDAFYKIDVSNPSSPTRYQASSEAIDGRHLVATKDGTRLFFTNAQDSLLYYLQLQ